MIIILLKHNQLVFYTNKTKQDFLHSLTSKNFTIELNTEDKNQIFSLVFQPASYNLLAKRKGYFINKNTKKNTKKKMNENSIENLIIALWKCSAIKLFLNKDHEVNNSICENEAMCLQVISDMLSYFASQNAHQTICTTIKQSISTLTRSLPYSIYVQRFFLTTWFFVAVTMR